MNSQYCIVVESCIATTVVAKLCMFVVVGPLKLIYNGNYN